MNTDDPQTSSPSHPLKACSICYLPTPNVGFPKVFLENLNRFKRGADLLLYSEHDWPDAIKLKGSPEQFRNNTFPDGSPNKFAMANAAFFTGLRIARSKGYTHVLALEPDCRVKGDHWDTRIFDEFFSLPGTTLAAGTLATYNPCNWSPEATRLWSDLLRRNARRNFPIATYGFLGAGVRGGTCIFPNGALAVYDLNWLASVYDLDNTLQLASQVTAWDMAIGHKIWERFAEESYALVGLLESFFSGFGELVSTEQERRDMLMSGKICAVHQIKSSWAPE